MTQDYQIGALWIGGSLSFVEQLCLVSFRDAGHHVKLYHYEDVANVPEGIELADGNEVLPMQSALVHARTGSPALQSDLFRYHLLARNDRMIWADTDAYCVKPFETPNGHFYGWESEHHVNGGVLGLPQDSDTLRELLDFTADEYAIPDWLPQATKDDMIARREAGNPVHASEMAWGSWGPQAITHFLHKTGEIRFALPRVALYPVSFKERRVMLRPDVPAERYITDDTFSLHLYGRRMRKRLVDAEGGAPHPNSMLGRLLTKHKVRPEDAPLPMPPPPPEPLTAEDRHGRGQMNLTDLADARQLDRGSMRHRYTELYQMLFLPFRQRTIDIALIGADGGVGTEDPAAWAPAAETMIDMWLEYFPKARLHIFDWAESLARDDPRVSYTQVDLDDADALRDATEGLSPLIVMDDATHASHHQQNAFRALFPALAAGGLYVIEDLRTQPASLEKQGLVKTASLFQTYMETGIFDHPDDEANNELNAMRPDFSGCFVFQANYQKSRRDQMLVVHKR